MPIGSLVITVYGQTLVIDLQTTYKELREFAAPSNKHVLVAWKDEQYMILDPEIKG